jgi:hypothetical protein
MTKALGRGRDDDDPKHLENLGSGLGGYALVRAATHGERIRAMGVDRMILHAYDFLA